MKGVLFWGRIWRGSRYFECRFQLGKSGLGYSWVSSSQPVFLHITCNIHAIPVQLPNKREEIGKGIWSSIFEVLESLKSNFNSLTNYPSHQNTPQQKCFKIYDIKVDRKPGRMEKIRLRLSFRPSRVVIYFYLLDWNLHLERMECTLWMVLPVLSASTIVILAKNYF